MILRDNKWYSVYPPGHSLLIVLGGFIYAPWPMNSLLGRLTVVLIYFLGTEIYNERTGRLAALLGALSPFLFIMSSGFMEVLCSMQPFSCCSLSKRLTAGDGMPQFWLEPDLVC